MNNIRLGLITFCLLSLYMMSGCAAISLGHSRHYHYHAASGEALEDANIEAAKACFNTMELTNFSPENMQNFAKEFKNM